MSDLVKRLRDIYCVDAIQVYSACEKAADRIEQLDRELAEARSDRDEWMRAIKQANRNGQQYEALQAELSAEKALADRLYESLNRVDGDYFEAVAAYRKARGL